MVESLHERIEELRDIAKFEQLSISERSISRAICFLSENKPPKIPSVYLLQCGHIRFLWTKGSDQIGLHFFAESDQIQFVINLNSVWDTGVCSDKELIEKMKPYFAIKD